MSHRLYSENFDNGPGGWFGWLSNQEGPKRLLETPSELTSRSPWWIDYNHAPPGAGYLHMLFCLLTKGAGYGEAYGEAGDVNRFIEGAIKPTSGVPRLRSVLKENSKLEVHA